jgi:hypothetical protein
MPIISAIPTGSFIPDSPSRIVPGAAADLLPAEDGEHHGRIGRRERGAEDPCSGPAEVEEVAAGERHQAGGREGAEHPERRDRHHRPAETRPSDPHAAVEEDDDQGQHRDPLDVFDRELPPQAREDLRRDRGREQEDGRRGDRDLLADPVREDGKREDRRDDEDNQAEMGELAHGQRA